MGERENWHWTDALRQEKVGACPRPPSSPSANSSPAFAARSTITPTGRRPRSSSPTTCASTCPVPTSSRPSSASGHPATRQARRCTSSPTARSRSSPSCGARARSPPIHDHTTWCVFGVIQGIEHEEVFDADLNLIGHTEGTVGDVNGFAPPGDIHRVHNTSDEVAITLHIYGTDVTRVGSSVRRYYDLPAER
jgi:hypothetical protein